MTTPKTVQLHVRIDPTLYRMMKIRAATEGLKLQDLVAELLRAGLARRTL